jgi:hypothetical protein
MSSQLESAVLRLDGTEYLSLMAVLLLACGFLLYYSYIAFKRFRFIDGIATSKIRSAAQGQVELKGLGEWMPNDLILSPFSNSRCIWYHCTMERKQRTGKRVTWTNISDQRSHHLFHLVDDTGSCIIDPENAQVIAETDTTWYGNNSGDRQNPSPRKKWLGPLSFASHRFRERLIRPATQLYALGWFRSLHSDPSVEWIQKRVDDLVKQWKLQPGKYLTDYDFDNNGKIQQDEWKAIRAMARKQVLASINSENRAQHLMSRPQDRNHPYILSAIEEEKLIAAKKLKACLSITAALGIFIALTMLFSIRPVVSL